MTKVYLSSTYGDLKDYRERVLAILRKLGFESVAMEDYVATGQSPPLAKCLADVAECDVYVGIFAWRYGYIPQENNPHQRSITELEYRKAESLGKPSFIFFLDESVPWQPQWRDSITGESEKGDRILQLRQEIGQKKLVSFFKNPDELAGLVSVALSRWQKSTPKTWVSPSAISFKLLAGLASTVLLGSGLLWGWQQQIQQKATAIAGDWQAEINYPWGIKFKEKFRLNINGKTVTGTATFLGTAKAIANGQYTADQIQFSTQTTAGTGKELDNLQNKTLNYSGKLDKDQLLFTLTESGDGANNFTEFIARKITK